MFTYLLNNFRLLSVSLTSGLKPREVYTKVTKVACSELVKCAVCSQ